MLKFSSSIDDCNIAVKIRLEDLSEYFPLILHNMYQQAAVTGEKGALKLVVVSPYKKDPSTSKLEIMRTPAHHGVTIKVKGELGLNYLMNIVPSETPFIEDLDYLE